MGFQFRDNAIHLDIAGEKFDIEYGPEVIRKIKNFQEENLDKMKNSEAKKDTEEVEKAIDEITSVLIELINTMCGDGAVEKIFKNRSINYYDLIDILDYITVEINKYREEKNKKYDPSRVLRK